MNVTQIDAGAEADILDDGHGSVLKLFRDSASGAASAAREFGALSHCRQHGFAVPEPLGQFKSDGQSLVKMTLIQGDDLGANLFDVAGCGTGVGSVLGQLHAELHRLPPCACSSIPTSTRVFETAAATHGLSRVLARLPTVDLLCHGDLHADNVMLERTKCVVLDWSRSFRGPPEADVAYVFALAHS